MEVARANNGRYQPGQSGNPSGLPGRPLGSRAAFSQGFTRDLAEVWQAKGKQAMNWTADNQPAVFFATCARLLPNDVRVTVEQQLPGNLSMEDLREVIAAVRQAIPDASSKPPAAVLDHVLEALRAAQAKPITAPNAAVGDE
jgi:hypothetical protein